MKNIMWALVFLVSGSLLANEIAVDGFALNADTQVANQADLSLEDGAADEFKGGGDGGFGWGRGWGRGWGLGWGGWGGWGLGGNFGFGFGYPYWGYSYWPFIGCTGWNC